MSSERRPGPWNIVRSARDAYRGLWVALRRTRSLQLGLAATIVALIIGALLRLSLDRLLLILLGGTLILAVETLNTAIEYLCDFVYPGNDERIGRIKDVAAGATAWTEIGGLLTLLLLYAAGILHLLGH